MGAETEMMAHRVRAETKMMAHRVAGVLANIRTRLVDVQSNADAVRATLAEAAELLLEDIDTTEIIFSYAFTVVPTPRHLNPNVTLCAAAKLIDSMFSEDPLLPGAIDTACDLVATLSTTPPPVTGALQSACRILKDMTVDHNNAGHIFYNCALNLGIQQGDQTWQAWSYHKSNASQLAITAETMLRLAILEAIHAAGCVRGGERMREAWKRNQILSTVMEHVEAALTAVRQMCDAIAAEEQIVRTAILRGPD
ncbi:hypothetical protein GUJ93_ZPchr0003g16826 [Zizania palustris]|uniref:Uncharacterized protein n=1 Tax=Zizania palustris TaxID=103762 RepID=A0A8J5VXQ3_ZIZPA|nr:hypothetical protein GUJ93_ZPchr0003g16826 [Zizania palustris]